ncbi:MAG: hypothetical protein B6A08_08625 [Sorangiineae bacterium NIC37A_2]|nr:MAG: hypothetical protein B6A08_08625 [Sorangiineae bacterium NIC37A_2]
MVDLSSLPPLFVGTSHLGQVVRLPFVSSQPAFAYLDGLLELGLTAFDLAASYQAGGTERLFGEWMRARKNRERLFLSTKGGHPIPIVAPHRLGRAALEADLEASLRRLGTSWVELYFLHRDDQVTPLEEIARTLASFLRAGKIRAWGVSNWTHERLEALEEAGKAVGLPPALMTSPQYSLFAWKKTPWPGCTSITGDRAAQEFLTKRQLAVLAWSPLGGGYLKNPRGSVYDTPENLARRARLQAWADAHGTSIENALLAFLKASPFPVYPSVATRSLERMRANLLACQTPMDEEDARRIQAP